ncbi:MAG: DUF305 domain-containing protein [Pseudonocardiales bacterium]|nr:DUF305 domain-containing protein [Pseudonocardiales bacterium]
MAAHRITSVIAAATVALTMGAGLGACGTTVPTSSNDQASAPSAGPAHNQADITFAQDMIPHHAQAIAMSRLAVQRAQSPQVKDLAARIQTAQQPEIDQMSSWLRSWNVPVPTGRMDHDAAGAMPGMMTNDQMRQLRMAPADKFDQMFLRMMIAHHEGAITIARSELSNGQNTDAHQLAQRIIDAQQREVTEMQTFPGV